MSVFHLTHTAGSPTESVILMMVHRRVTDEKVGVRKAALLALESIIRLDLRNISRDVSAPVVYIHMSRILTKVHTLHVQLYIQFCSI